jgi:type I restriction enzyme S subunit
MEPLDLLRDADRVPIRNLCTLQNGRAFKPTEWSDSGTPIIRIQNLNDPTKPFNYYSGELPERFRVRNGDVLLSWSGTPGTSFGCFRWSGVDGWLNQHIFNVRLDENRVLPDYFVLHVNAILDELIGKAHGGVGLRHITKGQLDQIELSIPSLEKQYCVVDLLARAENIVRMRREAEQKAKEIIPALFLDMFGDPATNPKGWDFLPLGMTGAQIRYGIGQPLPQIENGTPFLRATNVKRGRISREGLMYIDPSANPLVRNPPLSASDILVVRSGAYTGDIAQVGEEFVGAIAGYDLVVSPGKDQTAEFVATYLLLPQVQRDHIRGNTIRAAQPHLNARQLGEIPVPMPPLSIQEKYKIQHSRVRQLEKAMAVATLLSEVTFQSMLAGVFGESR